jgi:predicted nucleic acid-binding protein
MIILDTNVLSALMREVPDPAIESWLNMQPQPSLWITAVNVYEIRFGLNIMTTGRRRTDLNERFDRVLGALDHRILPFDAAAAQHAASLSSTRRHKGRPVELRDTMIAGIALARQATLATGNTRHFQDLSVTLVDPWTA